MRLPKVSIILIVPIYLLILTLGRAQGQTCSSSSTAPTDTDIQNCQNQINQQTSQLSSIQQQQQDLQSQLNNVQKNLNATTAQLNDLQAKYNDIHAQLTQVTTDLNNAQDVLDKNRAVFRARVRDDYINSDISGWELVFGNSYSFADSAEDGGLRLALINRTHNMIVTYTESVKDLSATKAQIAVADQTAAGQLSQIVALRNAQANQSAAIKSKLSYYAQQAALLGTSIGQLSNQLAQLQVAALAAKQAGNGKSSLGGAGSYRFYGYGTEHGVGMSQWGGFQLAHQGYSATQVLQYYYSGVAVQPYGATHSGQPGTYDDNTWVINVSGYGQKTYAQYLSGIGETDPGSWNPIDPTASGIMDQVQVIAARAYALAYTGGDPNVAICTDQNCQVYLGDNNKAAAVSATRNQVILSGGSLVKAYYFSTSGPHTDCLNDAPSFDYYNGAYNSGNCSNSGVYQRVNFNDTLSPFNNWSGIIPNSWGSNNPPNSGYSGGTPLSNADIELILNAGLLKLDQCPNSSGVYVRCPTVTNPPSTDTVKQWLAQEGTTPINDVTGIGLIRMTDIGHASSDRVAWVTATGSNRNITQGQMSGIRFRWVYNVLSPEKDWLPSTWFYVR